MGPTPAARRAMVFARLWAATEAIGKARGIGLAGSGAVSLAALARDDDLTVDGVHVRMISPRPDLVAAIARAV